MHASARLVPLCMAFSALYPCLCGKRQQPFVHTKRLSLLYVLSDAEIGTASPFFTGAFRSGNPAHWAVSGSFRELLCIDLSQQPRPLLAQGTSHHVMAYYFHDSTCTGFGMRVNVTMQ